MSLVETEGRFWILSPTGGGFFAVRDKVKNAFCFSRITRVQYRFHLGWWLMRSDWLVWTARIKKETKNKNKTKNSSSGNTTAFEKSINQPEAKEKNKTMKGDTYNSSRWFHEAAEEKEKRNPWQEKRKKKNKKQLRSWVNRRLHSFIQRNKRKEREGVFNSA